MLSPLWLTVTSTPDAGPAVSYPGDGTELDWEYDEERSRYYVRYPDDQ